MIAVLIFFALLLAAYHVVSAFNRVMRTPMDHWAENSKSKKDPMK